MNCYGSGFIPLIIYAMWEEAAMNGVLLTEASDPILTEGSDYLLIESV